MSDPNEKYQHGLRRFRNETAVKKQLNILRSYALSSLTQPQHKYNKRHALNCGDSRCWMCGNPRKFFNEPTIQEKRFSQDMDNSRNRHSNGNKSDKE